MKNSIKVYRKVNNFASNLLLIVNFLNLMFKSVKLSHIQSISVCVRKKDFQKKKKQRSHVSIANCLFLNAVSINNTIKVKLIMRKNKPNLNQFYKKKKIDNFLSMHYGSFEIIGNIDKQCACEKKNHIMAQFQLILN